MNRAKPVYLDFSCKVDGIPMQVSLNHENGGACFSIDDDDNDQRKQVLLSHANTVRLFNALREFLA